MLKISPQMLQQEDVESSLVFKTNTQTKNKFFVLIREEIIWKILLYLQTPIPGNGTANTLGLIVQYTWWKPSSSYH